MEDKLVKINRDVRYNEDLNEMCVDRLRDRVVEELGKNQFSHSAIWEMIEYGIGDILWKNRMTDIEVKVYEDFNIFSHVELDHSDIQSGSLTKMRQYIGVVNVKSCERSSFKEIGIVRHVLLGNKNKVCAVLYRQLDTSDIVPHRDVLALYIPRDYDKQDDNAFNQLEQEDAYESAASLKLEKKVGSFVKVYKENVND